MQIVTYRSGKNRDCREPANPVAVGVPVADPPLVEENGILRKLLQRGRHRLPSHDSPFHLCRASRTNLPLRSALIAIGAALNHQKLYNGNVSLFAVICQRLIGSVIAFWTREKGNAGPTTLTQNRNITWHPSLSRHERNQLRGQRGFTIWFTGLSASGKSTVATALEQHLLHIGLAAYRLDGDNVRFGLNKDLGFSEKDRNENIRRIAEVHFPHGAACARRCLACTYSFTRLRSSSLIPRRSH